MAGKKKITVELIEESTKDDLLDIAGRLGIEDKVNYKMLKSEIHEVVLTEFLAQQEPKAQEETSEDGEGDAAPPATAAERYRELQRQRRSGEAPAPAPEPEPEPEKPRKLSYHILKGGKETEVRGSVALRAIRRQLAIKPRELATLQDLAVRDGETSALKIRKSKGRIVKIVFIVRYS